MLAAVGFAVGAGSGDDFVDGAGALGEVVGAALAVAVAGGGGLVDHA